MSQDSTDWGDKAKLYIALKKTTDDISKDALKIAGLGGKNAESFSVFDNGCGTGGISLVVAKQYPNATVIAGDLAPPMIEATKKTIQDDGLTNISAELQDALDLKIE